MALVDSLDPGLRRAVTERLDWLARPCASLDLTGTLPDPRCTPSSSYLGGRPYLPTGADWPRDAHGPMIFLVQLNFAEVPPLLGFPRAGMLQWFVSHDASPSVTRQDPIWTSLGEAVGEQRADDPAFCYGDLGSMRYHWDCS